VAAADAMASYFDFPAPLLADGHPFYRRGSIVEALILNKTHEFVCIRCLTF
jgi:hypothetical protein